MKTTDLALSYRQRVLRAPAVRKQKGWRPTSVSYPQHNYSPKTYDGINFSVCNDFYPTTRHTAVKDIKLLHLTTFHIIFKQNYAS